MLRTFFMLAAALPIAIWGSPSQAARGLLQKHTEQFAKCAKICADCQLECEACTKHCLTLVADGKKEHSKTARLSADCGECCRACSTLCAREGPLSRYMLECCVKCCDDCGAACEKFQTHPLIVACAKSCQECAKECRALLKDLGN